jgi:hypothetical protein
VTTARSQNGWSANNRSVISTRTVRGTHVRLAVRDGPAGDLLLEVAALFDLTVQEIDTAVGAQSDDWGYAERPVRGSADVLSNHASGTAIDLNATRWPLGSAPEVNLSARQVAAVREIVAATGGAVRWGGDYRGRKDPMHFEITDNRTEADCVRALAALRAHFGRPGGLVTNGDEELDANQATQLAEIHHELTTWLDNRRGPQGEAIPGGGQETMLGYSTNADGFGYRLSGAVGQLYGMVSDLHAKLDWLHANTPGGGSPAVPTIDYDQLASALLRGIAGRTG